MSQTHTTWLFDSFETYKQDTTNQNKILLVSLKYLDSSVLSDEEKQIMLNLAKKYFCKLTQSSFGTFQVFVSENKTDGTPVNFAIKPKFYDYTNEIYMNTDRSSFFFRNDYADFYLKIFYEKIVENLQSSYIREVVICHFLSKESLLPNKIKLISYQNCLPPLFSCKNSTNLIKNINS